MKAELSLVRGGDSVRSGVKVDFVGGSLKHRRKFGGGRGQAIAKACGLKNGLSPSVVDVTAGLGKDAFVLASLGCQVTLLERSSVVFELLLDGYDRAQNWATLHDPELFDILSRMTIRHIGGCDYLDSLAAVQAPDVVYCDPMFPENRKGATVKKGMHLLQSLLGEDKDSDVLFRSALAKARYRVVVKRAKLAPLIANDPPAFVVRGKTTRYDVYTKQSLSNKAVEH